MFNIQKDPWEAAIASGEFYFTVNRHPNSPIYKMEDKSNGDFWCSTPYEERAWVSAPWSIREIREYSKNWTLVNKQEKVDVDNLYQKINVKQKQLRGLIHRRADLHAQAIEVAALIVKEEHQLAELKRELLSALKKELGS